MAPLVRLGAISLDCADAGELAAFYRDLLELEIMFESETFVALKGAGVLMTTQQVDDHQPTGWPDGIPKQIHLELAVDDLDAAETHALSLGATAPESQSTPDVFRVFIDPAGHPFCLTTMVPEV